MCYAAASYSMIVNHTSFGKDGIGMRVLAFLLCLLLILTGCAAPSQATREQRVLTETPLQSLAHPTAAPAVGQRMTTPAVAPPTPGSGVLLTLHDTLANRDEIHLVDPESGQDIPDYPPIVGAPYSLSVDGKKLAAIESYGQSCEPSGVGTACYRSADVLHLIDLQSWREVTATLAADSWTGPSAFSPDTRRLGLVVNAPRSSILMLFDTSTGQPISQRVLPFRPALTRYSLDGARLAIYGQPLGSNPGIARPDPPHVLLLDAATLDIIWDQPLASILSGNWCLENCRASHEEQLFATWGPAVVFSTDGRKLYIVHADTERLTTVDFVARSVSSVAIQMAQSWVEQLLDLTAGVAEAKGGANGAVKTAVLSPDGAKLYLLGGTYAARRDSQGQWQSTEDSLGLQVIDVASGRNLATYDTEARWWIRVSPDGAFVFLTDSDGDAWSTEVIDAKRVQQVARLDRWEVVPTYRLDGQPILVASQLPGQPSHLAVVDPRSLAVIHSWSVNSEASWVTPP
jgi:hypothetical protein